MAERAAKAEVTLHLRSLGRRAPRIRSENDGEDQLVQAFSRHQGGDKWIAPALGACGADEFAERLRGHGFEVWIANTNWRVGPDDLAMHHALIDGMAGGAREAVPEGAKTFLARRNRRLAQVKARSVEVLVGHVDLFATPGR